VNEHIEHTVMPHTRSQAALELRRWRARQRGYIVVKPAVGMSYIEVPRWAVARVKAVTASLKLHGEHCCIAGRAVHYAGAAAVAARPFITQEQYDAARKCHRDANSKHDWSMSSNGLSTPVVSATRGRSITPPRVVPTCVVSACAGKRAKEGGACLPACDPHRTRPQATQSAQTDAVAPRPVGSRATQTAWSVDPVPLWKKRMARFGLLSSRSRFDPDADDFPTEAALVLDVVDGVGGKRDEEFAEWDTEVASKLYSNVGASIAAIGRELCDEVVVAAAMEGPVNLDDKGYSSDADMAAAIEAVRVSRSFIERVFTTFLA